MASTNSPATMKALMQCSRPSRRLDCEITLLALAPKDARLDPVAGIDGWDIIRPVTGSKGASVWLPAEDVLYVTQFVDAAIELCTEARPSQASAIILRALDACLKLPPPSGDGEAMAGHIARRIMMEMIRENAAKQAAIEVDRAA